MSTVLNEDYQTLLNNNQDIDQFHQNIIESIEISKLRQQSQYNLEQSWPPYRQFLKFISQLTYIPSYKLNNYARTLCFIILLSLMFPFNLLITLITFILSYLINIFRYKKSPIISDSNCKRILISGGRMTQSLQLCRLFYQAGHQIILIDESINWLTGHRWSNSVERFYVHPSPIKESNAYINILTSIVRKEKINIFIPMICSYNTKIDEQIKSALAVHGCSIFNMNINDISFINNKYTFIDNAYSLGLTVPKTFLITSRQQLLNFDFNNEHCLYICKSILSNHETIIKLPRSTQIETLEYINSLTINEDCPYILQEFITGQKYSAHGTCINGELTLFTCSYSSCSQNNYKHIDQPIILEWCTKYIQALKLTGHISIDFIINDNDKKAYAIGCKSYVNSTITSFYNHPNIVNAYFSNESLSYIVPLSTARLTYWLPNELWCLLRNIGSMKKLIQSLKIIFYGKEAVWSLDDPLPFLLHYHIHIFYLLFDNLFSKHIRFFNKIDFCLGKLT